MEIDGCVSQPNKTTNSAHCIVLCFCIYIYHINVCFVYVMLLAYVYDCSSRLRIVVCALINVICGWLTNATIYYGSIHMINFNHGRSIHCIERKVFEITADTKGINGISKVGRLGFTGGRG